MYLKDLAVGSEVNMDMIKGSAVFETVTHVVGVSSDSDNAVLLAPFEYRGKTLDLGNRGFDHLTFNIYATDDNGNRVGWFDVKVTMKQYGGRSYYVVHALEFSQLAQQSERREHKRYEVNIPGVVTALRTGRYYNVELHDISDNGVSFLMKEDVDLIHQPCVVRYIERVNNKDYDLEINCRCVRKAKREKDVLYGCSFGEASNRVLSYVYIKKLLAERDS